MDVPRFQELFIPTLDALKVLGGSGSNQEIARVLVQQCQFSDDMVQQLHGDGPMTELEYRLMWARTYLKTYGLLNNSQRGVWSLTEAGSRGDEIDPEEIRRFVVEQYRRNRSGQIASEPTGSSVLTLPSDLPLEEVVGEKEEVENEVSWQDTLLNELLKMDPSGFERLCQRLLRESGFVDVEVTGRSGDGGIDGRGTIRFSGLIGFPVLFQCKRYSGRSTVTASQVRDFRGAMTGRADRGLIITTGGFTQDAHREAMRDGAPPIDLINGELLVDKLKELGLGVNAKQIEVVEVDTGFFTSI